MTLFVPRILISGNQIPLLLPPDIESEITYTVEDWGNHEQGESVDHQDAERTGRDAEQPQDSV